MSSLLSQPYDMEISPYTGLSYEHWVDIGIQLLSNVLSNVAPDHSHFVVPPARGKSYPLADDPNWRLNCAEFEAIVRSLNLAAPILKQHPDLSLNGLCVAEFYKRRIIHLTRPYSLGGLPLPDDIPDLEAVQMTCEAGGLAMQLILYPELLSLFSDDESEQLFRFLSSYGHARTLGHNWRCFNAMILLCLRKNGRKADEDLMNRHIKAIHMLHVGEGWFWDVHVDYYTYWVFQLYGAVFRHAGDGFIDKSQLLKSKAQACACAEVYPRLFSRDGHMALWGRSIIYRTAVTSVLPWLGSSETPFIDPGWARRLVSGNLKQFLERPETFVDGLPSLGFYGDFDSVVQNYSCSVSPFWMFLNFTSALYLDKNSAFWSSEESNGIWDNKTIFNESSEVICHGAAIRVINYAVSGDTELHTSDVECNDPLYQQLAFHTNYTPEILDPFEGIAMNYAWRSSRFFYGNNDFKNPFRSDWLGHKNGVLYRRLQMSDRIAGTYPYIDLADFPIESGIIRVDRNRLFHGDCLRLAHYALPHINGIAPVVYLRSGDRWKAIIMESAGNSLALIVFSGWQHLGSYQHKGCNAEADVSSVIYAEIVFDGLYPDSDIPLISAMLWRNDGKAWTDNELNVVSRWSHNKMNHGSLEVVIDKHGRNLNDHTVEVMFDCF